eukprot:COSAG01_NODE_5037_length_4532_cov_1.928265_4_plen_53_part_00
MPLAGSAAVLDNVAGQLCTYIGTKVVYHDLGPHLMQAVYMPTPAAARIEGVR